MLGSIAFGWYMSRKVGAGKDSSHFFLAGRNLPWWIVGLSLYATNIGAEHLVGLTGDAYRYGLSAGTVELTTAMCLGIAAAALFPYYIRNQVFTIPEIPGDALQPDRPQLLFGPDAGDLHHDEDGLLPFCRGAGAEKPARLGRDGDRSGAGRS